MSGPLPALTENAAQKTLTPDLASADTPKTAKPIQRRKRKTVASTPKSEQAKKKKVLVVKPEPAECKDLDFIKTLPDAATMMNFPPPKINHSRSRPLRVPRHLYSPPSISEEMMNDPDALEREFQKLLIIRETIDWEQRRMGRRLRLLEKKTALEEQQEEARRLNPWEQDDEALMEDIKKLEKKYMKLHWQEVPC